jgi:ABC-2 type transport system ATP-binding protein
MSAAPAIEVRELYKTYRDGLVFRRRFEALKGVSLEVERKEIFGLLGPNGAGKTTLVKLLLGIVKKTRGEARMLGLPAGDRSGRKDVGYLPENLHVPRHHTANSALDLYGQLSGLSSSEIRKRRGRLLELVELADRAKDSVRKYSKGMLQRLGLAVALLHDPQLIFMDEPTDGLDPAGRARVRQVLLRLKAEGKTIFLNSHLLQEVEMVCDRVAILDRGVLRGIGTVDQLVVNQPEGIQIEMQVLGSSNAIQAALDGIAKREILAVGSDGYKLRLELAEQQDVDRCIDALRSRQVSIISLAHHRMSLEEAFLEVLGITTDQT